MTKNRLLPPLSQRMKQQLLISEGQLNLENGIESERDQQK
eukprot:CAMPEP_0202461186 /NCGR_PEP_ID=MMETSP1360-20130828/48259_1 /ASSEMBLY_ACC=CAM_ASM_000848 /TAXON_ID=515479 /ORGANISM="Licmophora paradoxa, Strain CCMP2313" /LENGTH=39 /DNA_ID= /DNA_START= /DNA_END= /DNA_ORIENTATION=